jgi:hypothetical protein
MGNLFAQVGGRRPEVSRAEYVRAAGAAEGPAVVLAIRSPLPRELKMSFVNVSVL